LRKSVESRSQPHHPLKAWPPDESMARGGDKDL
jgi:hypothetical protein